MKKVRSGRLTPPYFLARLREYCLAVWEAGDR